MKKHLAIIALIIIFSFLATQVGAAKPEIEYPAQYAELRSNLWGYHIIWTCDDPNVDHYLVAIRKFTYEERDDTNPEGSKIVNNENVGGINFYNLGSSFIEHDSMYKIKICVVRTDGTRKWSNESYFYIGTHNGIANEPISFKIWFGFTPLTKEQIYYAAQAWHNAIGGNEKINTYPFSEAVLINRYPVENGTNAITKAALEEDDSPYDMETTFFLNSSGKEYEADINVNPGTSWANSAQYGHKDVQSVMTHEMGHALGLTDKYDSETWARYPYSLRWTMFHEIPDNDTHMRSPEQYDIEGVNKIYSSSVY